MRIELPFDKFVFGGGLQSCGHKIRDVRGHAVYGIHHYRDLNPILGDRWHIRGLNKEGETVLFHLHRRQSITDFHPDKGQCICDGGYLRVFRFVRIEGVQHQWQSVINIE